MGRRTSFELFGDNAIDRQNDCAIGFGGCVEYGAGRIREIGFMQARWAGLLAADPFYNPNLSLRATDYRRR